MPEITREQIEAYRDSLSLLVTDFDREMARACLAALDRAEAADCEADQLAELVLSLEEQRASAIEERDEERDEAAAWCEQVRREAFEEAARLAGRHSSLAEQSIRALADAGEEPPK